MKNIALVLLLLSTRAWADWTLVNGDDTYDLYADMDTIRKRGNMVEMWGLYDLKTAQQSSDGKSHLSIKTQEAFDCLGLRTQVLAFSWYSENMGGGEVVYVDVDPGAWKHVRAKSVIEALWKVACTP